MITPTHTVAIGDHTIPVQKDGLFYVSVADLHRLSGRPIAEMQEEILDEIKACYTGDSWRDYLTNGRDNPATYTTAPAYIGAWLIKEHNPGAFEILESLDDHPELAIPI